MSDSDSDSDAARDAEERARIAGCCITEDELKVAAHAEASKKRRRDAAPAVDGAEVERHPATAQTSDFQRHTKIVPRLFSSCSICTCPI